MFLQVALVAIVTRSAIAWPITPLDGYSRTDKQVILVSCGDVKDIVDHTTTILNFTLIGYDENNNIPAGCTVKIRVAVDDIGLMKFGVRASGFVDITDLTNDEKCAMSNLTVADEDTPDDEMGSKKTFCGDKKSFSYNTTEDILIFELAIGANGASGKGFQLMVEPHYLCGGEIELEDKIQSPGYPTPYPRDINCIWRIQAPEGHQITIKCEKFDLKPKKGNKCVDYFLWMAGGERHIYCGKSIKEQDLITIESNVAIVDFRSNKVKNRYTGFKCKTKFVKKTKDLLMAKFFK